MKTKRPYNVYNIFFILERARLLQEAAVEDTKRNTTNFLSSPPDDVCPLNLPDLPPRYHGLHFPSGWYIPRKNAKRKHVATNGLRNFVELAQTVAQNWRSVDEVTLSYCKSVARIVKEWHESDLTQTNKGLQPKSKHKASRTAMGKTVKSDTTLKKDRAYPSSSKNINTTDVTQAQGVLRQEKKSSKKKTQTAAALKLKSCLLSNTMTCKKEVSIPRLHINAPNSPPSSKNIVTMTTMPDTHHNVVTPVTFNPTATFRRDEIMMPILPPADQGNYYSWNDVLPLISSSMPTIASDICLMENDPISHYQSLQDHHDGDVMQFDNMLLHPNPDDTSDNNNLPLQLNTNPGNDWWNDDIVPFDELLTHVDNDSQRF